MKKALLIVLLLSLATSASAQFYHTYYKIEEGFVGTIDRYRMGTATYLPDGYNGSPYQNESFVQGTIYQDNTAVTSSYFFRYNAIEDDIEVKENITDDDTEIQVLAKSPNIYVKISNDLFVYDEKSKGYFQVLVVGNNFNLYKKIAKKFYPERRARNSFEKDFLATYKDNDIYYVVDKEGNFYAIPSSKNKRSKFFGNKKAEISKFINNSKLNINEENSLIRVFRYFDSFEDISL